ncbi:MAG TPA: trimethylamine methyltransferase [Clostridia bacterium]|nr:trimethylamine methyltransferase [Clostridia bacterium]
MRSNYTVNASTHLRVLSDSQLEEIHYAVLEVLERTGVDVYHDGALDLLKKAGAYVSGNNVRIPSAMVEAALKSSPSRVTLCTRDKRRTVLLEGYNFHFGTGSDCPFIIDLYTGQRRKFTKKDVAEGMKLCDALPNIDFVMSMGLISDIAPPVSDRHQFEAMLLNTTKPIVFTAHNRAGCEDILAMSAAVAGGIEEVVKDPFICLYAEPISPLKHMYEAVDKLIWAGENRIPVVYTPCIMSGATAPATLAGAMVSATAETLAGLCIHQIVGEGAPFIMGGVYGIMDMHTTIFTYGSPEFMLMQSAVSELAHFYRKPVFSTAGCSDSKVLDEQAAIEAALSILLAAQSGGNLIHDVGYLESGIVSSFDMLVMCDEIIGMVKRIVRGIEVDDETLAVDVIHKVGPGGHFLAEEHTMRHFRSQTWFPSVINRQRYEEWVNSGSLTLRERVTSKAKAILAEHVPKEVSGKAVDEVQRIIRSAEDREL